ncbi:MICAL-like protein 1 isoform X1 [Neodiprion lecontei]|uniref:MICAL-like protein 1 isoform X1 n=2 Tax=Neodiprion lecontei TaxID=441921 RepID=A0ABM3G3Y5_NEOLC|nr:MICAL-like protein 1 isoform X1 [Neodiprion lecontei]XP_046594983.1 MICAL-like protein 1 isoform X1 [Neodiprion lecontei]
MAERRGTKALELWCRRITEGYPGVNVQNMTTSWRDGLAFCAMIHHFRPDLVDFNSLNKDDVYGNNELAFRTAEQHLGIPALLDAEDMASCAVPDRLSILTYLSQFYQTFGGLSPSRSALKRTSKEEPDARLASVSGSPQPKMGVRLGVRKEPCVVCGLPVFLAEKLVISRSLYHRTCFRCARCNNQLTLGNYYETEEGQYCCETCPDEEATVSTVPVMYQDYNQTALSAGLREPLDYRPPPSPTYKRALSDEEKSSKRTSNSAVTSEVAKIRLNFMTNQLLVGNEDNNEVTTNELRPRTTPANDEISPQHPADNERRTPDESDDQTSEVLLGCSLPVAEPMCESPTSSSSFTPTRSSSNPTIEVSGFEESGREGTHSPAATTTTTTPRRNEEEEEEEEVKEEIGVNNTDCNLSRNYNNVVSNQRLTATANHDLDDSNKSLMCNEDTKDTLAARGDEARISESAGQRLSLVQQRLMIFENNKQPDVVEKRANEPNSVSVNNIVLSSKKTKRKDREKEIEEVVDMEENDRNIGSPQESDPISKQQKNKSPVISQLDTSDDVEVVEHESFKIYDATSSTDSVETINTTDAQVPKTQNTTSLLNVSGVDLSTSGDYPEDLNPFQSDDSDEDGKIKEEIPQRPAAVHNKSDKYVSTNPFGSSDDENENDQEVVPPRPAARNSSSVVNKTENTQGAQPPVRRRLQAPQINLNPFWSDDEDCETDEDNSGTNIDKGTPVPKPRTKKLTPEPSPVPRKTSLDRGGHYASNTSIGSAGSLITPGGTYRKKKPAPPPPMAQEMFSTTSTFDTLTLQSPDDSQSATDVPLRTPRIRKTKPAPPPPIFTSTPQNITDLFSSEEKNAEERRSGIWDDQKSSKDETNRNRQSLFNIPDTDEGGQHYSAAFVDKSAQGKWKRKKGPAPPRPIPHKRKIKVMSIKDVKLELDEIELQQQGLEKQGVRLEQLIRDKCETGQENEELTSLRVDVEELVLELFALVNEKNELFRRQAELMLLRRQQRLEEEHADVEYQIRCLMSQPEATKTDSDKQREEVLIQRLVEIVERRNEIVECLEMDRRREVEEDRSINEQMGIFAAKSKADLTMCGSNDSQSLPITKKEKLKDKVKEKKVKKNHKKDADKDVDETELKLKRHKRKWF